MSFLETMLARAKADKQTIVLPEGNDPRTLEAAEKLIAHDACNVIVLGNEEELKAGGRELRGVRIIDPETSDLREKFAMRLYELRKHKGMTPEDALDKISDVLYFGVMMVKCGEADGMV
ncbi:phosphate acyltransferase, partial [Ellagibacter isourolithinifaciens]